MDRALFFDIAAVLGGFIYVAYLIYFKFSSKQAAKYKKMFGDKNAKDYSKMFSWQKIFISGAVVVFLIINLAVQLYKMKSIDLAAIIFLTILLLATTSITVLVIYSTIKPKG